MHERARSYRKRRRSQIIAIRRRSWIKVIRIGIRSIIVGIIIVAGGRMRKRRRNFKRGCWFGHFFDILIDHDHDHDHHYSPSFRVVYIVFYIRNDYEVLI